MWSEFQTKWIQFPQASNTEEKTIEEVVFVGFSNLRRDYFIETSRMLTLMDKVREIAPMGARVGTNMRSAELDKILAKLWFFFDGIFRFLNLRVFDVDLEFSRFTVARDDRQNFRCPVVVDFL